MTESVPLPGEAEVVVVGGGLAGLSCALLLERRGVNVHLVEASDDVGGRVRTDEVDGFLLDRGFQVLSTAYEEVVHQVDLPRLDLQPFVPGALVWTGSRLERLADPFRNPASILSSVTASVGSLSDKMRVAKLRGRLLSRPPGACFVGPDRSTLAELEALGFSDRFIDGFFRPFMGGVLLDRELATSAKLFRYHFRCFAAGQATLPARGMQRLPELLAAPLEERITLDTRVVGVTSETVTTEKGHSVRAERVVVAVDGDAASRLLGGVAPRLCPAITTYFAAERAPTGRPILVVDGEGTGPANHVAVLSNVAPGYAPSGQHLVSVSGVGEAALSEDTFHDDARAQLQRWFGTEVGRWRHLRTYRIEAAVPVRLPGSVDDVAGSRVRDDGVIVAGDHTRFGSIQGALQSGRHAAEAALGDR